jgi:hypothetical protein
VDARRYRTILRVRAAVPLTFVNHYLHCLCYQPLSLSLFTLPFVNHYLHCLCYQTLSLSLFTLPFVNHYLHCLCYQTLSLSLYSRFLLSIITCFVFAT